jgi:hypothetical protein
MARETESTGIAKLPTFIETPTFARQWEKYRLNDATLLSLQNEIVENWASHPVIQGTNGVRKVRFSDARSNTGTSGSFCGCYVYFDSIGRVHLLTFFAKNVKENITKAERNMMAELVKLLEGEP